MTLIEELVQQKEKFNKRHDGDLGDTNTWPTNDFSLPPVSFVKLSLHYRFANQCDWIKQIKCRNGVSC